MAIIKLQNRKEFQEHIYYEYDSNDIPLGKGGMGTVYKGRRVNELSGTYKPVAIKLVDEKADVSVIERARREAGISIRHDNLVEMLGFIEYCQQTSQYNNIITRYYIISELLEGVMLDDLLCGKFVSPQGVYIPYAEELYREYQNDSARFAMIIVRNVLSGLMALHDAGYIHRDIDPTNIMITKECHIKLIDFGIAKSIGELTSFDKGLTQTGAFMGKPWYAAPELVLGDVLHQNFTTDIYAVGILFYQLYVGKRPFDGEHVEVLDAQLHNSLPLKQIKKRKIRKIIAKATHKRQEQRYHTAVEFIVAVDSAILPDTKTIPWKIIAASTISVAASVALLMFSIKPEKSPNVDDDPKVISHQVAVGLLCQKETIEEGIKMLYTLSDSCNDYASTYLLSQLMSNPEHRRSFEYTPDSVSILQLNCIFKVEKDDSIAHTLLKKAVEINPNDCVSLYALGCDYFIGDRLTFEGRDVLKAQDCFERALKLAELENNQELINRINKLFEDYGDVFKRAK